MIRIAITGAAYHAICSTLPEDAPLWPVQRRDGECLIHIEAAVLDGSQTTCDQVLRFYLSDQVDIVSKRASISAAFLSLDELTMKRQIKTLFASGVLALALIGTAIAGPFEDGQAANRRDDYAEALRLWGQLADQGNARAQFSLGKMYYIGQGVLRDYAQGRRVVPKGRRPRI